MSETTPIRRSVSVRTTPERAFRRFTEEMGTWWPVETHSRAATGLEDEDVKVDRIEFQPREGGAILEHLSDGRVLPWAEVLVWEPPHRFVMAWKPHPRPVSATEVEVTFTAQGKGTLVELEHRGWEHLADDVEAAREGYADGWIATLERFARAADDDPEPVRS